MKSIFASVIVVTVFLFTAIAQAEGASEPGMSCVVDVKITSKSQHPIPELDFQEFKGKVSFFNFPEGTVHGYMVAKKNINAQGCWTEIGGCPHSGQVGQFYGYIDGNGSFIIGGYLDGNQLNIGENPFESFYLNDIQCSFAQGLQ